MSPLVWCMVFVWCCTEVHSLLDYDDILKSNISCQPKDTCTITKSNRMRDMVDWKQRNCFCDDLCKVYGDCCINAKLFDFQEQRKAPYRFDCVNLRHFGSIYMKTKCLDSWTEKQIRYECEKTRDLMDDPIAAMPVTSPESGYTYKNYYCAICNNDGAGSVMWFPRVECRTLSSAVLGIHNITEDFVQQNLNFEADIQTWGVKLNGSNGDAFHSCVIDPVFPPSIEIHIRKCKESVRSCPSDFLDDDIRLKCQSYTAYVYHHVDPYRNYHCAMCNNVSTDELSCREENFVRLLFGNEFNPIAFSVVVDLSDGSGSSVVGQIAKCSTTELYDPFLKSCRKVYCAAGKVLHQNKCYTLAEIQALSEATKVVFEDEKGILHGSNFTPKDNLTNNSLPIMSCPKFRLFNWEYMMLRNNSIYLPGRQMLFDQGEYILDDLSDNNTSILVCAVGVQQPEKFDSVMAYTSVIAILISIICIILHLCAFCLVPELRNLSGKNLASLSISLLLAYCSFFLGQFRTLQDSRQACGVLGIITYYGFLASFFWMNSMSYDIWRTLKVGAAELRVSSGRQWRKYFLYAAYSWLVPLMFAIAAAVIDVCENDNIAPYIKPAFGVYSCWFGHRPSLLVFFGTPLAVIMLVNSVFFVLSSRIIITSTNTTAKFQCKASKTNFKLYFRLALIMGFTWIIGITVGNLNFQSEGLETVYEILWYIFIFSNALQGLFIFLTFTCTRKVYTYIRNKFSKVKPLTDNFIINSPKQSGTSDSHDDSTASQQTTLPKEDSFECYKTKL